METKTKKIIQKKNPAFTRYIIFVMVLNLCVMVPKVSNSMENEESL